MDPARASVNFYQELLKKIPPENTKLRSALKAFQEAAQSIEAGVMINAKEEKGLRQIPGGRRILNLARQNQANVQGFSVFSPSSKHYRELQQPKDEEERQNLIFAGRLFEQGLDVRRFLQDIDSPQLKESTLELISMARQNSEKSGSKFWENHQEILKRVGRGPLKFENIGQLESYFRYLSQEKQNFDTIQELLSFLNTANQDASPTSNLQTWLHMSSQIGHDSTQLLFSHQPPLYEPKSKNIPSAKDLEDFSKIDPQERQKFAAAVLEAYPEVKDQNCPLSTWMRLYQNRDRILQPKFQKLYRQYIKLQATTSQTPLLYTFMEYIGESLPSNTENFQRGLQALEWFSKNITDKLKSSVTPEYLLFKLSLCSESALEGFRTLTQAGLITDAKTFADFFDLISRDSKGNFKDTQLYQGLKDGSLNKKLAQIKTSVPQFQASMDDLLLIASWSKDSNYSDVIQELSEYPNNLLDFQDQKLPFQKAKKTEVSLKIAGHFILHPDQFSTLRDKKFKSWLKDIKQKTNVDLSEHDLIEAVHIYQKGPEAREKLFEKEFQENWHYLSGLLNNLDMTPVNGSEQPNIFPELIAAIALLEYPNIDMQALKDFDQEFLKAKRLSTKNTGNTGHHHSDHFNLSTSEEESNSPDQALQLFVLFNTIRSNPAAQNLWEEVNKPQNSHYGAQEIAQGETLHRVIAKKEGYHENPDWNQLPPLFKFYALSVKRSLQDPHLQTQLARYLIKDVQEKNQELGGRLEMDSQSLQLNFEAIEGLEISNEMTVNHQDPRTSMAFINFHQHSLEEDNSHYAGPSSRNNADLSTKKVELVITSAGFETIDGKEYFRFNVDIYTAPDTVLDLGIYRVPREEMNS
ncbi:MAG: hypothetical protein H7A32_02585 [Deltaproteobacteria bacterium]|nr:hypothetical protein [Deltaproteobacteria bacterium]